MTRRVEQLDFFESDEERDSELEPDAEDKDFRNAELAKKEGGVYITPPEAIARKKIAKKAREEIKKKLG